MTIEPPLGISSAARLALSAKEKQEITIVRTKFSRVVSARSAFQFALVGKADGMHEESRCVSPLLLRSRQKPYRRSRCPRRRTASGNLGLDRLGERLDALEQRLALIGEGELRAMVASALAMPQAIEWSLATPIMRPRLPSINLVMLQLPSRFKLRNLRIRRRRA